MKVFDLHCENGHIFEGWFSNQADFDNQIARGILCCPMCDSPKVHKKITAARLKRKSNTNGRLVQKPFSAEVTAVDAGRPNNQPANPRKTPEQNAEKISPENLETLKAHYFALARHLARHSEDVGENFAAEARRIHAGDAPQRAIRGQSNWQQTQELLEEGIAVLPLPEGADKPLQ